METKEKNMITVKATRTGYYNHRRYREGEIFQMEEEVAYSRTRDKKIRMEKGEDGKEYPVLCSWLEHAEDVEQPKPAPRRQLRKTIKE